MNDGIYVGIDSGGTRTNVRVEVVRGGAELPPRQYEVRESLSGALPPPEIPRVLSLIVSVVVEDVRRFSDLPVHVWISAAGFTPWTRSAFLRAIRHAIPDLLGESVARAGAANDGVTLLLAFDGDAVVIAGTGSTVLVRSTSGTIRQAGGHEWVACDYGSGFWIGVRAIRQAYRDYEAGRSGSPLLQRFRDCYDISEHDPWDFIKKLRELAIGDEHTKRDIAKFAASVCHAASNGVVEAQNVVKDEVEVLADVAAEAFRREDLHRVARPLTVVQGGSLLDNDFYQSLFEAQLEMRLLPEGQDDSRFDWLRMRTGDEAAVRMAKHLAGDTQWILEPEEAFRPAVERFR
jgi:N-acetylglucosamine kinase-like BadF-type ATPase